MRRSDTVSKDSKGQPAVVAGVDKTNLDLLELGMAQNDGGSVTVLLFAALRDQAGGRSDGCPCHRRALPALDLCQRWI